MKFRCDHCSRKLHTAGMYRDAVARAKELKWSEQTVDGERRWFCPDHAEPPKTR